MIVAPMNPCKIKNWTVYGSYGSNDESLWGNPLLLIIVLIYKQHGISTPTATRSLPLSPSTDASNSSRTTEEADCFPGTRESMSSIAQHGYLAVSPEAL